MKRLVYAPKVNAWVKTDTGIVDLAEHVVRGQVDRKLDQVSTAELTIRNPNKYFTDHNYGDRLGPVFHPMDPIAITLTRLENRPVQVFTGFLDETPYVQMFPGTVTLKASCTLKKLLYTFFDPGLEFFSHFLAQYGWQNVTGFGAVNPEQETGKAKEEGKLTESGLGEVLLGVLTQIGGWPQDTVWIEQLPPDLLELITNLFEQAKEEGEEANKELKHILHKIIGTASLGEGGFVASESSTGVTGTGVPANLQQINRSYPEHLWPGPLEGRARFDQTTIEAIAAHVGLPPLLFYQITKGESMGYPGIYGIDPGGTEGLGLWMITTGFNDELIAEKGGRTAMFNPIINGECAKIIYDSQGSGAWYGTKFVTPEGWAEDQ